MAANKISATLSTRQTADRFACTKSRFHQIYQKTNYWPEDTHFAP